MSGYQCPHCNKGMKTKQALVKHLTSRELRGQCPVGTGERYAEPARFLDDAKAAGLCDSRARVSKRTRRLSVELTGLGWT